MYFKNTCIEWLRDLSHLCPLTVSASKLGLGSSAVKIHTNISCIIVDFCVFALQSDIDNGLLMRHKHCSNLCVSFVWRPWLQSNTYATVSLHDHVDLEFPLMMPRSVCPVLASTQCPHCPTYRRKIICFITSMMYY